MARLSSTQREHVNEIRVKSVELLKNTSVVGPLCVPGVCGKT